MKAANKRALLLVLAVLLLAILACSLTESGPPEEAIPPQDTSTPATEEPSSEVYPPEPVTVQEPGGAELAIAAGALSGEAQVRLEQSGEGTPFAAGSPLSAASSEYSVDYGDAQQTGQVLLTVPLEDGTKLSASTPGQVYLAWAQPPQGTPAVVGVHVVENGLQFPVIGAGKYQVYKLLAHDALMQLVSIYDPLAVPTYQQRTPAWCSPTAMTDLANFHQGSWPVGGFGAVWGESSNYYLAGKAGQPFNTGYFFHWLLGAGGYSVPENVKQSFSNGNAEVIIWNWNAALFQHLNPFDPEFGFEPDLDFADALFDAFQAYVESFVWGHNGQRQPVAWGSSLAGHSRIITGSNGTEYYFNNPSSGSLNDSKTWAAYRQEIMDSFSGPKIEVIDTVVFYAPARPENQRRGVLWLYPMKDNGFEGSVALIDGASAQPATNWVWDGSNGHEDGYYYEDLRGVLPADALLGVQFKALDLGDQVQYGFGVKNISTATRDYHVDVVLQNENLSVLKNVGMFDMTVGPDQVVNLLPAESFNLVGLQPGLYTLKFVLLQGGLYQDVKYVQFRVAPTDLQVIIPEGVLKQNAFCRLGPDPVFDDVTAFELGTKLTLLGVNPERTWGKFEKMVNEIRVQCWIALSAVDLTGGETAPVLPVPARPTQVVAPVCTSTLDREACEAAGGTYFVGAASATCMCPE
ncbi:MAG: hypothetical protein P8X64_15670 [Anaerolineales bacterium]|jgi:hypothetical protein